MRNRPKLRPKQDNFRPDRGGAKPSKVLVPNAEMIANMMRTTKTRGNPRDYVLISGARLIDCGGAYDLKLEDGKTLGLVEHVALVHKRRLHVLVGDEYAALFWRRRLGMRAAADAPKRWIDKHGALPAVVTEVAVRPVGEEEK